MSLLLVLAMVLAMVPAAMAAYETYSVEPGATITVSTTTAGFAPTKRQPATAAQNTKIRQNANFFTQITSHNYMRKCNIL